ncbi:MAG: TraR/DksA family transcriptional regulator [bacterium]
MFRNILMERRRDLLKEMTEAGFIGDVGKAFGEIPKDSNDAVDDIMQREIAITTAERERRILAAIDDALARIEDGTYGMCAKCGEPIDEERLKALPFARLCIKCKAKEEKGS